MTFLLKRATELAHTAATRTYMTHSDFLSLYEQDYVLRSLPSMPDIEIRTEGGYENAERRVIEFIPTVLGVGVQCPAPICALHITPVSYKYAEALTHRDYLGALVGLGMDRSLLGDILIEQNYSAYVFCAEHIADYIREQLSEVRHTKVMVSEPLDITEINARPDFRTVNGTIASERLDGVIALAFRFSRGTAVELIKAERVFVNGRSINSASYTVKSGNVISVRGYGKLIYDGVSGVSRKERLCVSLRIYQ